MPEGSAGGEPRTTLSPADIRSIFVGLMLAMLLSALDQTIVATAMPTIGREFGEVENLPWIVTSYLIASTAVTPLYGKFSDMHGRRVTLLIGIAVFVLGSVACALAPSLLALIVARAVQGLGGGGLIALAQTIVADMVTPRERGRYQVYFGAAFACASLAGPVLGGFFAEHLHWSLIFWINLPLGGLAFWLTNDRLRKLPRHERRHRLDVLGAALITAASATLMLALSWGGVRYPWLSGPMILLAGASLLLWSAFTVRIATATEPLIPLGVLLDPVIGFATLASATAIGVHIGLAIFVPIYFEVALGLSARESGLALIPLMFGVVFGATASGRLMARVQRYKLLPTIGTAIACLSIAAVFLAGPRLPFVALEVLLFLCSAGLGSMMPVATVSLQNAAPAHHLGTATAAMNFSRQLMSAITVAAFGAILFSGAAGGRGLTLETLTPAAGAELSASFHWVFGAAALGLAIAFLLFLCMEERPLRDRPVPHGRPD